LNKYSKNAPAKKGVFVNKKTSIGYAVEVELDKV